MLDGRHHLHQAQALVGMLPFEHAIKLCRRQCLYLKEKLERTLQLVVEKVDHYNERVPPVHQYVEVLKEFHLMAQKVKAFVDDCCYENDNDFVLAAIGVTAHSGRFFQYNVELDWCLFLVECLREADLDGKPVYCQTLQEFNWEQKLRSLRTDTRSMVAADEGDLKALLEYWMGIPGEHRAICWSLLRRFEEKTESDLHILPGEFEVPPITTHGEIIGRGGQGTVYEMKWKEKLFAVKFFEIANSETINGEVHILERCCHPHIVGLILAYKKGRNQYLLMERLSRDLESYVLERREDKKRNFPFPHLEVVEMISQVCEAMLYLNDADRNVSHRDLKPRNLLIKELGPGIEEETVSAIELQVADFGVAKERMSGGLGKSSISKNSANRGTTEYRAPEMTDRSGEKIRGSSLKADMYSFAVTASFILNGTEPYTGYEDTLSMIKAIKDGARPDLPDNCPPALSKLLKRCWDPDPRQRPASFSEILKELRELKARLLTSAVDRSVTFNAGDRRLNILLLGASSELVEDVVRCVCGDGTPHSQVQGHERLTESKNSSPPMSLYRVIGINRNDFKVIKSFVKDRNERFHRTKVEASWWDEVHHVTGQRPGFSRGDNNSLRLHAVWYVIGKFKHLPDRFKWADITKRFCDLPVQILVTGEQDLDSEYEKILQYRSHFFPNAKNSELIVKVSLTDGDMKENLWRQCWAAKTRAEIANVAKIIREIRKKLGSGGISIPVGVGGARISKEVSLSQSREFVTLFLSTYWDIPLDPIHARITTFTQARSTHSSISIRPCEFVKFCLVVAAIILFDARDDNGNPKYVSTFDLQTEAQDRCLGVYFARSTDLSYYNNMRFKEIQAFLQSVFEREGCHDSHPEVSVDRSASFSRL